MTAVAASDHVATGVRRCPACAGALRYGTGRSMTRCRVCGTLSAAPPSQAELATYYNGDYQVEAHELTPGRRQRWTPLLAAAETATAGRRGLDFGSSGGAFLRLAAERGWRMTGVELDGRARAAHSRLAPEIDAWPTLAAASAAGATSLDAAWILHTIEHVPRPAALLEAIGRLLRPGSVLVVTTPNGATLQCRTLGRLWEWWTPPAHLALFTPAGLRTLLAAAGYEAQSLETRRGDSMGLVANLLLAPARATKRLHRASHQSVSVRAASGRLARVLNLAYDPPTAPIRRAAYARGLGAEIVAVTRRRAG